MKFYFDGDSFTYGGGLRQIGVAPEDVRWSRLVCDHFGAKEINLASGGASNNRVMRQMFGKPTTEVYDFYFLQTTEPVRKEFYDIKKKKWITYKCTSTDGLYEKWERRCGSEEGKKFAEWIDFEFRRVYNDHYGKTKENITYNALKSYVASVGREKKSFFSTMIKRKNYQNKYDLYFNPQTKFDTQVVYDRIPNDGHPSVEGHKAIAKYVIDIVSERL